jgi:hypothetical protein
MGPRATTFKIKRSRVPWGRSDFGFTDVTSVFYILEAVRVEVQGVLRAQWDVAK